MQPLQPLVTELFEELKNRQPAEDESVPYRKNGFLYQWRYHKDAQYRTWYRAPVDSPGDWRILLDECELANGHDYFSLGALAVSPDTNKLAYSVDTDGSERYLMHVVDINSGASLTPPIADTLGSPTWNSDSTAMLYVVVNQQWQPLQVYRRELGASDSGAEDPLIFSETDTGGRVRLDASQSEEYVFI